MVLGLISFQTEVQGTLPHLGCLTTGLINQTSSDWDWCWAYFVTIDWFDFVDQACLVLNYQLVNVPSLLPDRVFQFQACTLFGAGTFFN